MSAYGDLVVRAAKACRKRQFERTSAGAAYDPDVDPTEVELDNARAILAEAFRTLETVTPEMIQAELNLPDTVDGGGDYYLAMLHASPPGEAKAMIFAGDELNKIPWRVYAAHNLDPYPAPTEPPTLMWGKPCWMNGREMFLRARPRLQGGLSVGMYGHEAPR